MFPQIEKIENNDENTSCQTPIYRLGGECSDAVLCAGLRQLSTIRGTNDAECIVQSRLSYWTEVIPPGIRRVIEEYIDRQYVETGGVDITERINDYILSDALQGDNMLRKALKVLSFLPYTGAVFLGVDTDCSQLLVNYGWLKRPETVNNFCFHMHLKADSSAVGINKCTKEWCRHIFGFSKYAEIDEVYG